MDAEKESLDSQTKARYKRIRLVKKFLRPLPRRGNIRKYPILKYFADTALKRSYLWEFKRSYVVSAIWIGWIIALIPMYGLQMVCAFLLCIAFRGNAIIAMLLQWVTNPITIPPILFLQYVMGDFLVCKLGMQPLQTDFAEIISQNGILEVLKTLTETQTIVHIVCSCLLGGLIISIVGALLTTAIFLGRSQKNPKA